MLDRRRPIARDDTPVTPTLEIPKTRISMNTSRKPISTNSVYSNAGLGISAAPAVKPPSDTSSTHSSISRADTKSKALPKAPTILSTQLTSDNPPDHITELRQQMDDISLRRANINKAIHNLTKAQAENQNPMLTDWRSARAAERKVDALKSELADIGREEHDIGLKLHRAYKRREREGDIEGTSALWVRRVTG